MRLALLAFFFALPAFADGAISLKNDREGKSFYTSKATTKAIDRALKKVTGEQIVESFNEILEGTDERQLCAYNLNAGLSHALTELNPEFSELSGAIHYLRSQDEIDDVVAKILLKAEETSSTSVYYSNNDDDYNHFRVLPRGRDNVRKMLDIITGFEEKYLKRNCYDEAYRMMVAELRKVYPNLRDSNLEALFVEAYEDRLIDMDLYKLLERARENEIDKAGLDLKTYYQRIKTLRTQYPLRDPEEKSEYISQKLDKHTSRRQRLLENYNELQIIMMGNVVKRLRTRLDSSKIEILVYDRDSLVETIPLEPMERFRFAIKILRKEMVQLSLNTYFNGRSVDYLDLMTAAYETGIIPAVELEEIAGLQDIWSPKKTFWQKAGIWVRSFGMAATLVIPPPYGFVPALAIVVIEATVGKKDEKPENTDLF